jgi:hypothetical protein
MQAGSPAYAHEKLLVALESLATGAGDVRERLAKAFLSFHPVREEDFPPRLRSDWRWIMHQLTRCGPVVDHHGKIYRGSVENTMYKIKRVTGVRIAKRLLYLYHELDAHVRSKREL